MSLKVLDLLKADTGKIKTEKSTTRALFSKHNRNRVLDLHAFFVVKVQCFQ